jgi:HK97 family phage portal protein
MWRTALARLGSMMTRAAWWPSTPPSTWGHTWFQGGNPSPSSMTPPLLTFPAVFTSIDTISSDIARLPIRHYRMENGKKVEVDNSAALRVLEKPNGYQTRFDLMKQFVASQLYRGNGYLYAIRNRRYEVEQFHCLFPDFVRPYRAATEVFYDVTANPLAEIDVQRFLTTRECLHHRMLTLADPLFGITPLMAAALSTSAGMAIIRQSERFFNQMARPSGVLQTAGKLDPARAQAIKERWQAVYKGEQNNAGDVAVLEEGLQWTQLSMTSVDAQLIEQLRYTVEDVARVYRLPIFMLGDLTKVSYNSSEQLVRIYYSGCLVAHLVAIEDRFTQFFDMNNRTEWLEFDTDYLFRTEMQARVEALAKSVQGGLRTPNEARSVEGLNPVSGGDMIFMQQQMVPVEVLATRSDLTAKPPGGNQPGPPALPAPERSPAATPSADALRDALMGAVFSDAPPRRALPAPIERRATRRLIHGRRSHAA